MFSAINHLAPPRFHRNLRNLKPSIALPARGVRDGSGRKLPSNPEGRSRAPQPYLRPLSNRTEFLWTTYQRWGRSKLLPPPRLRSTQLECQFRKCWRRGQWPPSLRKHQVSRPREIEACHAPCERGRAADERFRPALAARKATYAARMSSVPIRTPVQYAGWFRPCGQASEKNPPTASLA